MVYSFLNQSGYQAVGCHNTNEAYDAMYGKSLHLIISDIMMPETDGYEFAKTVRSLNENILILFMTARDDFAFKQKGYQIGIDDYMVKPMDLDELFLQIGALLRRAKIANSHRLVMGMDERTAVYNGENIAITTREFNILYKLLSHPGKAFTRTQLMDSEDTPERLILQTECPGIGQGLEEQITSFLYNHSDTGLVVIDTLQKVRSCDQSGSMYASDYKDVSTLKSLADKYGICILLIHHLRKQAASDPFDQISGSNGLMGAADTTWVMQRKRTSKNADIILTGRDLDRRTLYLHEENCIWLLDEEETAEEQRLKAVPEYLWRVAEYVEQAGKWQGTATELLSAVGVDGVFPLPKSAR